MSILIVGIICMIIGYSLGTVNNDKDYLEGYNNGRESGLKITSSGYKPEGTDDMQ